MNKYTEELKKVLKESELIAIENSDPLVSSEHILLSLLKIDNSLKEDFIKENITYEIIKKQIPKGNNKIEFVFYSNEILKIIEKIILSTSEEEYITLPSLIKKTLETKTTNMYKILNNLNINIEKLLNNIENKEVETKDLLIKNLATNLNDQAKKGMLDKVIGRDKEVEKIIEILARKNKNNPILIGEAGVGKTAIVEELARRIVLGKVPTFLKNKEILNLNISDVISGTKYRGEFEEKLTKIIKELESKQDLIIFIDEIHTIVGAGGAEGAIDASNILKPALARGKIKCIGATTLDEFKTTIEKDKALERRFQKILVKEPDEQETKTILKKIKKDYEEYHNVKVSDNILDKTITLSKKYLKYRKEPDKSIDILDEICAKASIIERKTDYNKIQNKIDKLTKEKNDFLINNDILNASILKKEIDLLKNKIQNIENKKTKNKVTLDNLKEVLESKTNSKIFELEDKKYIKELNKKLKEKIHEQNNLIDNLTSITDNLLTKETTLPSSILINTNNDKIINDLITEYSKILKINLIKINKEEFNNELSINKIIGSPAGYVGYNEKTIFESIKTYPISIIQINNYKELNQKVINILKSILETGKLTLSNNETLYFNNTIFIFTKNKKEEPKKVGFITNNKKEENNTFNYILEHNEVINTIQ